MSLLRFERGESSRASASFDSTEFDCNCKYENCTYTVIDTELLEKLERVRGILGKPVHILSGYRCAAYQLELGNRGLSAAKTSQHCLGRAADIKVSVHIEELIDAAETVGFLAIGVAKRWIHVDTRTDRIRRWTYD